MTQDNWTPFQFLQRIKELEEDLIAQKMIAKSEKEYSTSLKEEIEKLELHKESLIKINEHYSNIISSLRLKIKENINKI
jgi:hypothetical protein